MWQGWSSSVSSIAVARLAPGASLSAARDEYLAIERRTVTQFTFRGAHVESFTQAVLGNVQPILATLGAAVALLLADRVSQRRQPAAASRLRARARDLGAARARRGLCRHRAATLRGGRGTGRHWRCTRLCRRDGIAARRSSRSRRRICRGSTTCDSAALRSSPRSRISSAAVLLFGMLPALFAARSNLASPLRLDSRSGSETRRRRTVRQALVASQIALAMIMLAGAALLARSLERLERQDLGLHERASVDPRVLVEREAIRFDDEDARAERSDPDAPAEDPGRHGGDADRHSAAARPQRVAGPLRRRGTDARPDVQSNPFTPIETGGPDFFKTFGIPLVRGRSFSPDDQATGPYEVIVSESVARRLWPGQDPIGKRIRDSIPADYMPGGTRVANRRRCREGHASAHDSPGGVDDLPAVAARVLAGQLRHSHVGGRDGADAGASRGGDRRRSEARCSGACARWINCSTSRSRSRGWARCSCRASDSSRCCSRRSACTA